MNASFKISDSSKTRAARCFLFTAFFSLLAHGYRYLSMSFSGDSLLLTMEGTAVYQSTLGRFLQPVYWQIRGLVNAPWLIGLFSTIFLAAAVLIAASLFDLERPLHLALLSGLMVTGETFAVSNATYLPWMDVYALSLLLCLLGAAVFWRCSHGVFICPVFYALACGLYQSYLPAASTMIILLLLRQTLRGEKVSRIFVRGLQACASLVAGLLLYAVFLSIALKITGGHASQEYNGVGNISHFALDKIPVLLLDTFKTPLEYLFSPSSATAMPWHINRTPAVLNLALLALSFVMLLGHIRKLPLSSAGMVLFLVLLLPFSMNFIQFVAQGAVSGLTIYTYAFFYLAVLFLSCAASSGLSHSAGQLSTLLLSLMIGLNIIHSNQLYVKRDLELSSTLSAMTRILNRAEETEGYIPGETLVVPLGLLSSSALVMERPGFEAAASQQGMNTTYAAAHEYSMYWYLQMMLGENMAVPTPEETRMLNQLPEVASIPAYPAEGFAKMLDGRLFIRFN